MKKLVLFFLLSTCFTNFNLYAQCDVNFGSGDARFAGAFQDKESGETGLQTITAGVTELLTLTTSHDIWDETTNDCTTTGGVPDITITQELNGGDASTPIDVYGGIAIPGDASDKMNITQIPAGLRGSASHGQLASSKSSTGDLRYYEIAVNFAPHVTIEAQDFEVDVASVNTRGKAFESMQLIFLDQSGTPYGTATYNGFWLDPDGPGGVHPGVVGACPIAVAPIINPNIYTTTGTGVYTISETGTMDLVNACTPAAGSNGSEDTKLIHAETDAGLNSTDLIGGFIFRVNLENVATAIADEIDNGTRTSFSSRLNGFNIAAVALPVELSSFTANKNENNTSTDIEWTTESEINNDYFLIERSADDSRFEEIGMERGFGNSTETQNYSFVDRSPLNGKNYYRLKQVDFDGTYSYSDIVVVDFEKENTISIYPTFVSNELNIILDNPSKNNKNINIIDLNGRHLSSYQLNEGEISKSLDISFLPIGSYFISFQDSNGLTTHKFIKR